jgi:hypothetical protein
MRRCLNSKQSRSLRDANRCVRQDPRRSTAAPSPAPPSHGPRSDSLPSSPTTPYRRRALGGLTSFQRVNNLSGRTVALEIVNGAAYRAVALESREGEFGWSRGVRSCIPTSLLIPQRLSAFSARPAPAAPRVPQAAARALRRFGRAGRAAGPVPSRRAASSKAARTPLRP